MAKKLSSGNKNILGLIRKGQDADGWAPVSSIVAQLFSKDAWEPIPPELFEFEFLGDGAVGDGRARLTALGNNVLDAMVYL